MQKRKPRFKRTPSKKIEPTARDIEIVSHIFNYRFLRSTHIISLLEDQSSQRLLRRLGLLYHNGYLDRPPDQLGRFQAKGSKAIVYALGNKGADLISQEFNIPRNKVDWTSKNRTLSPLFLDHKLLIADVLVSFELACKKRPNVRLIKPKEILKGVSDEARKKTNPFSWTVNLHYKNNHTSLSLLLGVIPDYVFGLQFLDQPTGKNKVHFFLEADRGKMPVIRRGLHKNQSSFYKKMLAYSHTHKQGLQTKYFNFKNFRVLTVTTSEERIRTMIGANMKFNNGQGSALFFFTYQKAIEGGNILDVPLFNGQENESVRLIDLPYN